MRQVNFQVYALFFNKLLLYIVKPVVTLYSKQNQVGIEPTIPGAESRITTAANGLEDQKFKSLISFVYKRV